MANRAYRTNPTRLVHIDRARVALDVKRTPSGLVESFTVERFELSGLDLPPDAEIAIVAYSGFEEKRIGLGTVGAPAQARDVPLQEIDATSVVFRAFVHRPGAHCLLASCEGIRPKREAGGRMPLLRIQYHPLGERMWDVMMAGGAEPVLRVNDSTELDLRGEFDTRNPLVRGLIVPQAFEQVLMYLALNPPGDDDPARWQNVWKTYLLARANEIPVLEGLGDLETVRDWARDTARTFAHEIKFVTLAVARKVSTGTNGKHP